MRERNKPRGRGGKLVGLGLLAALVGLVAAYFADCIPGLGVGGTTLGPQAPAESAPAQTKAAAADAIELSIEADRCRRGDAPALACAQLCEALGTEDKAKKVLLDATLGTHAAVDGLRRCLEQQGFHNIVVRTE